MGAAEKTEALEPFDPERMASRILGMGDVVSLVEQVNRQVDTQEAERLARKVVKGKGFRYGRSQSQLEQLQKMGGVAPSWTSFRPRQPKGGCHQCGAGRP